MLEWTRKPVPMIEHPVFGRLRASVRGDGGRWLWESLDLLPTSRGEADLSFQAGPSGPDPSHEVQLHEIVAALDPLTAAAAPMIDVNLGGWLERSIGDDPWTELEWRGACLTGSPDVFDLHYSSRSGPEALIMVRFEAAEPVAVRIDD